MLNQMVLVGRVKELPIIKKTSSGVLNAKLIIDVERGFRNANGEIEIDTFSVTLWRGVAEECIAICSPGSLVGVRGRLQASILNSNNIKFYNAEIIAEKISFLSD